MNAFVFQVYPHPDVVECCLVLLHLSKSSMSFSDSLLQEAKDLLRKYGTSPSVLKASQRFLIWFICWQFGDPPDGLTSCLRCYTDCLPASTQSMLRCVQSETSKSTWFQTADFTHSDMFLWVFWYTQSSISAVFFYNKNKLNKKSWVSLIPHLKVPEGVSRILKPDKVKLFL